MKSPLSIGVVPPFWYSVPLLMPVILKCVTSVPSAALREMTGPLVLLGSSLVSVALSPSGASLTAVIAVDRLAVAAAIAVVPPLVVVLTVTRVSLPAVLE